MLQRYVLYPVILLCLSLPLPALAISTLNIAPAGDGAFLLSGAGLENLAGIDVTVSYDATLLSNPRVVQGNIISGAMMAVNSSSAGVVRLAVISSKAIRGDGPVATLTFDRTGDSDGLITSLKGKVVGLSGATLPVIFNVTNPPPPLDSQNNASTQPAGAAVTTVQGTNATATATANAAGVPIVGGTLSMPSEETTVKAHNEEPAASAPPPEPSVTREVAAAETRELQEAKQPAKAQEQVVSQAQSILERFRLFAGERSARNLMALFATAEPASFRQDPPIFIADGKESVKVTIKIHDNKTPNFAFSSARYVSYRKVSEGTWLVEVRPDQGVSSASITILTDGAVREIPLTVSPKAQVDLIKPGNISEADFALFLKERGTANAPKFDLNGDGKRDYLDDYIFTANYLVEQEKKGRKNPTASR